MNEKLENFNIGVLMAARTWEENVDIFHKMLLSLSISDRAGKEIGIEQGFLKWQELTLDMRASNGHIYLIGNGASAAMASHFAADLAKNAQLHTEVFTDLSLITAISNDIGYEHVFAEPLRRRGREGDMLVAISSSGRSPNILAAVRVADELNLIVVTLSGMNESNPLRSMGAINLYVGANTYGMVETCHAAILHHWMDLVQLGA